MDIFGDSRTLSLFSNMKLAGLRTLRVLKYEKKSCKNTLRSYF